MLTIFLECLEEYISISNSMVDEFSQKLAEDLKVNKKKDNNENNLA